MVIEVVTGHPEEALDPRKAQTLIGRALRLVWLGQGYSGRWLSREGEGWRDSLH